MWGIVAAMPLEYNSLLQKIADPKEIKTKPGTVVRGRLGKAEVALGVFGMGKVNSSLCAAALINDYNSERIINFGIAGSLSTGIKTGLVVIGAQTAYHDVDLTIIGLMPGQFPDAPARFNCPGEMLVLAEQAAESAGLTCSAGLIVTGDAFAGTNIVGDILHSFPDALAVDMESAAVSHTCHKSGIPHIVIRCISDTPVSRDSATISKKSSKLAAKNAALVVEAMLKIKT